MKLFRHFKSLNFCVCAELAFMLGELWSEKGRPWKSSDAFEEGSLVADGQSLLGKGVSFEDHSKTRALESFKSYWFLSWQQLFLSQHTAMNHLYVPVPLQGVDWAGVTATGGGHTVSCGNMDLLRWPVTHPAFVFLPSGMWHQFPEQTQDGYIRDQCFLHVALESWIPFNGNPCLVLGIWILIECRSVFRPKHIFLTFSFSFWLMNTWVTSLKVE